MSPLFPLSTPSWSEFLPNSIYPRPYISLLPSLPQSLNGEELISGVLCSSAFRVCLLSFLFEIPQLRAPPPTLLSLLILVVYATRFTSLRSSCLLQHQTSLSTNHRHSYHQSRCRRFEEIRLEAYRLSFGNFSVEKHCNSCVS